MGYEFVDLSRSSRKAACEKFIGAKNPIMVVTSKVDITRLYKLSKKGYKLNALIMYALLKAAKKNEGFFYDLKDNKLIKFDDIGTNLVIKGNDGELYYVSMYDAKTYLEFEKNYISIVNECKKECKHNVLEDVGIISTSAVVNCKLESIVCGYQEDFVTNFIAWGKYEKKLTKVNLNMSLRFHHAFMDGEEVGKFFNDLNEVIKFFKV